MHSKIYAVKERWKEDLMQRKGVEGVGVGPNEIIVFAVPNIVFDPPIPTQIEGIRVRVKTTGKFHLLGYV